jgi:CRISPR-associated endonuclease/helicase Cas3
MEYQHPRHIAHVRTADQCEQTLETHLLEVAAHCKMLANKINASEAGELIGLLHDFGKYSDQFQNYIRSGSGLIDPDLDETYVDAKALKGKIDHSSAGAQWIWRTLSKYGRNGEGRLCAQIMALCIASHHSGLIDSLKPNGENGFMRRISKDDALTHLEECKQNADEGILERAGKLCDTTLLASMLGQLKLLIAAPSKTIQQFNLGFWTRFLFSCLIDADRISSADFENPENVRFRNRDKIRWDIAIDRLETHLRQLQTHVAPTPIDAIRQTISDACKQRATDAQGIYTLTVPTGGGKTLASLRYALHHAEKHGLERIIYVIPYTSIIEQNADAMRRAIERDLDSTPWVLEHHCNLEPEHQTWHSKLAVENWDAPIVLTTMVQFLETLFSGGTRGVRRLHQLANSVLIFDEVQTLPIRCTHLFCNALNFLTLHAKTTAVLCTATQPLLDELKSPEKGQLSIPKENELMADAPDLFKQLERVSISNKIKAQGWSEQDIAELAIAEYQNTGNCLVIVNTKAWARALYLKCSETVAKESIFHLSTSQCPAHRQALFRRMRERLNTKQPVLCISTQLIEAGVDIDFASVIRFLAGLDSIAQAAGRCNRNGWSEHQTVHVVNPAKERIERLTDIKVGRDKAQRVLSEVGNEDLLAIETMKRYFKYYFYERADEMVYLLDAKQAERDDSMLSLLSENKLNVHQEEPLQLRHAFMTAGKAFQAIDAPTKAVIVPYGEGKQLIIELCALSKQFDAAAYHDCLKRAQKFSVNLVPNVWQRMADKKTICEIHSGEGIYYLDECYYSPDFGLSEEIVAKAELTLL